MRVNVYAEEITDRVEIVEAVADTGSVFKGVRFYLESSDKMFPPKHPDDDSSAVTFWIRSTKKGFVDSDQYPLVSILERAVDLLNSLSKE